MRTLALKEAEVAVDVLHMIPTSGRQNIGCFMLMAQCRRKVVGKIDGGAGR